VGKTFVGLGFGPIQTGLFLLEAQASGKFDRLVVCDVVAEVVTAVHSARGKVRLNIAHADRVEACEIEALEVYNPNTPADTPRLIEAIASADEISTALPSVDFYRSNSPSPAKLLALGFERKLADERLPRAVVYTAENDNHAAEKLRSAVVLDLPASSHPRLDERVAFLNTVIGKMSGIVSDRRQIERDGLVELVAGVNHAVLVEAFNRVLISRIPFPGFHRGIDVAIEKMDLFPFEEAKLYGHNAAHALLGYLAHREGLTFIADSGANLRQFVESAFLEEAGGALCQRYRGIDPLFTPIGWASYARELIARMNNPFLRDRVDRVIRDPFRKLAWNDRLIGTMRLALQFGIEPNRFALGAAVAAQQMLRERPGDSLHSLLADNWELGGASSNDREMIFRRIELASQDQLLTSTR
jgi:mannitol-1-phosphate 5-dehydrogenase